MRAADATKSLTWGGKPLTEVIFISVTGSKATISDVPLRVFHWSAWSKTDCAGDMAKFKSIFAYEATGEGCLKETLNGVEKCRASPSAKGPLGELMPSNSVIKCGSGEGAGSSGGSFAAKVEAQLQQSS